MTEPKHKPASRQFGSRVAWACTLLLLAGIAADRAYFSRPTAEAGQYHEVVRGTAEGIPFHFDRWLGIDAPVPQSAITMLKPNFILSRNYQELGRDRQATLLVVQCKDSRDILGHYPPVCYVNQGWAVQSATPRDWAIDDLTVHGTRYVFSTGGDGVRRELVLDNFMILPSGRTARDMDEVDRAARDSRLKHFGAAQVQLVYDARSSEADRTEIFQAFARQLRPTIDAITRPGRNNPS